MVETKEDDEVPCNRMGHLMLLQPPIPSYDARESGVTTSMTLYVHGGMAGSSFFNDFFRLCIERVKFVFFPSFLFIHNLTFSARIHFSYKLFF